MDPRSVAVIAVALALIAVLAWKAWWREDLRRAVLPAEAAPPPAPVTDVSDRDSRRVLLGHRENMRSLRGTDEALLIASCGLGKTNLGLPKDAIRLTWREMGYSADHDGEAFYLDIDPDARGNGALASWHYLDSYPPPPPRTAAPAAAPILSSTTRRLDAATWRRALDAVRDPGFVRLAPGDDFLSPHIRITVESCTDGRYHLVERSGARGAEGKALLRTVRTIEQAAGRVHAMPQWMERDLDKEQYE